MEPRKDIIDELKKFNKDLEHHLPNLDLDFVKDLDFGKKVNSSQDNDEYFSLLANNLMELRTEIALTRKNLTTEVEGMVLRTLNAQQNKFFDQVKKFYGVMVMEIKDNFSNHLKNLSEELNTMKRKYGEIAMQNENFGNQLDDLVVDVKDMKNELNDISSKTENLANTSRKRFDEFYEKLDALSSDVTKKKSYIEENLIRVNRRFAHVEHMIESLVEVRDDQSKLLPSYSRSVEKEIDDNFAKELHDVVIEKEMKSEKVSTKGKSRLFDINEKLQKLDSLR